ncbi:hypothetical protein [Ornithinimicrobium kibberense]|uniref:hypothetical protein n=1 Tax=Ornithinimicrobium kibberense TaxID=282060 RepID=UPI00362431B4
MAPTIGDGVRPAHPSATSTPFPSGGRKLRADSRAGPPAAPSTAQSQGRTVNLVMATRPEPDP